MLAKSTKERIKEQKLKEPKLKKHSNPSLFATRVKNSSTLAIKDLTLVAKNLDEKYLEEIFTAQTLSPFIEAILESKNLRTLEITKMLAKGVYDKLMRDLHKDMANQFSSDLGKSWFIAQMAVAYWDKPFSSENNSII